MKRGAVVIAGVVLAGCASGPPPPDWQLEAHGSMQRALQAQLRGDERVATQEFDRARREIASTGRIELMARAELMRCAAQVAALQFEVCAGFERYRADAAAAELAYADHLQGTLPRERAAQLPPPQQALAAPPAGAAGPADLARLQAVADPLSRLVGAALWLRSGHSSPEVMALAAETASAQGWRRPLLAWLRARQRAAELAGDAATAAGIGRRIELVLQPVP